MHENYLIGHEYRNAARLEKLVGEINWARKVVQLRDFNSKQI